MSRLNAGGSNITDIRGVRPLKKLDGGQPPMWSLPTAAAAQLSVGEMVNLSGTVGGAVGVVGSEANSSVSGGLNASGYGILGFCADDVAATTAASTMVAVHIATPDTVFVGNVNNFATSASAQTAHSDIGQRYALRTVSGKACVDKTMTAASNTGCRVIGLYGQDDHPCFYGRVEFIIPSNNTQLYSNHVVATSGPTGTVI